MQWTELSYVGGIPGAIRLIARRGPGAGGAGVRPPQLLDAQVNPELGVPGAEVSVSGFSYPMNVKVAIRFNALDGPVLAELEPTASQDISGTVRIPPTLPRGAMSCTRSSLTPQESPTAFPGGGR